VVREHYRRMAGSLILGKTSPAANRHLKPAPNDHLQRWPVSKRVNSSKAGADDATLIERIELAAA
jgi:hypothetical protein